MNDRRYFFKQLASGLVAACAPALFLPKLIEQPQWKRSQKYALSSWSVYFVNLPPHIDVAIQGMSECTVKRSVGGEVSVTLIEDESAEVTVEYRANKGFNEICYSKISL